MIFDEFIKAGLIKIGGDDDIYDKLITSSKELAKELLVEKIKIINYALVSLDKNIAENEPVLKEVEECISKTWKMIRSQFGEMPIAIYRAVILQALENLAEEEAEIASIIWMTCSNTYQYLEFSSTEQDLIKNHLNAMGNISEDEALKEWTIDREIKNIRIPNFKIEVKKTKKVVDQKQLTEYFIAASGPQGEDGVARNDPNANWTNGNQSWSYQFAPRAAKGVTIEVNKALELQNNDIHQFFSSFEKQATSYFTKLKRDVSSALKDTIQSSLAIERRSQLLWWKESLYSKSQKKSYSDLTEFQCSIAMPFDLFDLLPAKCPVSVDYILKETFNSINSKENKIKLFDYLTKIEQPENKSFLEKYFIQGNQSSGRVELNLFISEIVFSKVNIKSEMISKIGITQDAEIKYSELAIWILHCLLAKRLSE